MNVILKNEIKEKHQRRAGIYEIGPSEINNQNFWIKEDGSHQAIWFHPSQKLWVIGPKDRLGTSTGSLVSLTDEKTRCPLDMKKGWMFKSEKGWVDASKDIKIGCGKGILAVAKIGGIFRKNYTPRDKTRLSVHK